jgi:gliding motility-associated-like protein
MRKLFFLTLVLLSFFKTASLAQSCFNVAAGNDTTVSCLQSCLDLKAKIPDVRTTDDYKVVSIPYQPFPYVNAGGVVFNPAYKDDSCSDVITLPFTFCFYGVNYTQCVVGTNGILTFELSNANTFNAWLLNLGTVGAPGPIQPIPYTAGGTQNDPNSAYYPRACIMGPYHDIDPEFTQPQPPNRRMEYIVVGNAPCRKFILNFNEIPYYQCPNSITTQQMVLYEGTGIIDIFLKDKPIPCQPTTNEGRAILGLQDWDRKKAVVVNGRNNTVWSATNEGWRFIPSGTTSLFKRVELYKNGILLKNGTTTVLGNGELEASFQNICQSEDSMSYTVKAFYQKCDNTGIETEGSDTVIVYKNFNDMLVNVVNPPSCFLPSGTITVIAPVGANIEYSIDGITWQMSPVFIKPLGNYTVHSRLIGSLCTGAKNVTITAGTLFDLNGNVTNLTCHGQAIGQVRFLPNGPGAPYQYSKDGGATYQLSNIFLGLAGGPYVFRVKDNAGCIKDTVITVTEPPAITSTANQVNPASCYNNDGQIAVIANGGTPGYSFSIDNGVLYQTSNVFTGLANNVYNKILIKDANGCEVQSNGVTVILNDQMFLTVRPDTSICAGSPVVLQTQTNVQTTVFAWTPSQGLNFDNIKSPTASPVDTIRYTLNASWGICNRTGNVLVNVLHKPVVNAGKDTIICYQTSAFLKSAVSNLSGPVKYLWTPVSRLTTATSANTVAKPDSTQLYTLTVSDNYGCHFVVSDNKLIIVRPEIIAFAGNDSNAIYGKPHQLSGGYGPLYSWSPATPLDNPFAKNPLAILYTDTHFSVMVSNDIGCSKTDDVYIKVYKGPTYYIPNSFSPNGDGSNDVFRPIAVGIASTEYFKVFNRYGQLFFQNNQFMQGWDGTYKGKKADAGAYVWMIKGIDETGKTVEMKGTVILIR